MIIEHAGSTHLFEKFTKCGKVCGLFFLIVLFGFLTIWIGVWCFS